MNENKFLLNCLKLKNFFLSFPVLKIEIYYNIVIQLLL